MKSALTSILILVLFLSSTWAGEIQDAAENGELQKVKDLLRENPQLIESRDEGGHTPLLTAAYGGQKEVLQFLLSKDADLMATNNRGSYALNLAAYNGQTEMIQLLIDLGFEIDIATVSGFTPLLHASVAGKSEAVNLLLEKGASLDISDSNWGGTAIHWACNRGNDETRDFLLSYGADLSKLSPVDSSMPIFWAAFSGNLDAIKWLIANGISANTKEHDGWTPLHNTVRQGHVDVAKYLLENGADYNATTESGETPFMASVQGGNLELSKLFLEMGAKINTINEHGETPLHQAIFGQNSELIKLLIDNGADVNALNNQGSTPLFNATYRDNNEVAELLVDGGAQVNSCNRHGYSPLNNAIIREYNDIVKLLIDKGADLNLVDTIYNQTGLHLASIRGNTEAVNMLLNKNVKVNAKDKNGFTPLYYAGKYGHRDVADLLISNGGKTKNKIENYGWSPALGKNISKGEAYIWYLGHCGFAIKTSNNLLIFDYTNMGAGPTKPSLSNGHINPDELKNQNVYVFASHEHSDHFDSTIFAWDKAIKNCNYIFGLQPENLPQFRDSGYTGPTYEYFAPRETRTIDNLEIITIESNDAGVGFLVKVDGLEIYHAGDHAGWRAGQRDGFTQEIDFLTKHTTDLDFAFVNVTGCHVQDTIALAEGTKYTLENLKPKLWFPTHGSTREYVYKTFSEKESLINLPSKSSCAENRGDMFYYNNSRGI
ncbi:MAG: hypothetical protein GY865_12490 [candidate division Zixibacteria bacterium]|nr:hypothetical protein [candidate division Zixibacteria bacterium]